jgi:hypothetical protein
VLSLPADLAEGLLLLCLESNALPRKRLSVVLGHVAEAAADRGVDRPAAPAHLAPVGLQHPQDDPHGGGLASAVRADEPEHLAFPHREREIIEGDDVAVAAAQPLQLEHLVSLPPGDSPLAGTLSAGRGAAVGRWEDVVVVLEVEAATGRVRPRAAVLTRP